MIDPITSLETVNEKEVKRYKSKLRRFSILSTIIKTGMYLNFSIALICLLDLGQFTPLKIILGILFLVNHSLLRSWILTMKEKIEKLRMIMFLTDIINKKLTDKEIADHECYNKTKQILSN